jgi:hypothetical protein
VDELVEDLGGTLWYFYGHSCNRTGGCFLDETASHCMNRKGKQIAGFKETIASIEKMLWLPRLDQLLAEIEKRGYRWDIQMTKTRYVCGLSTPGVRVYPDQYGDTPEDAAAQALLWILNQR